jgi:hypothetical protein
MLDAKQRWLVLGGLLTATLAAAAWVHDRDEANVNEVAEPVSLPKGGREAQPAGTNKPRQLAESNVPQVRLDKLDARGIGEASKDPFAVPRPKVRKQAVSKPAPVVIARTPPPPPPSAPPLPFKYMGKMVSGDDVSVFLILGQRNLVVHEGDTIDSNYRIERIAESSMTVTYLPLQQRQTLDFRGRD